MMNEQATGASDVPAVYRDLTEVRLPVRNGRIVGPFIDVDIARINEAVRFASVTDSDAECLRNLAKAVLMAIGRATE